MKSGTIRALRAPNRWGRRPVHELWLDTAPWSPQAADAVPRLQASLAADLPAANDVLPNGAMVESSACGARLAHLVASISRALQLAVGSRVEYFQVAPGDEPQQFCVVIEYEEELIGRACAEAALEFVNACLKGNDPGIAARLEELREFVDHYALGPSTKTIVRAAQARMIPVRRLNLRSFVQLGHGNRQRLIHTAETSHTGIIAEEIAQDKELTRQLLRASGIPSPKGRLVDSPADAWEAAQEIGVPVVVKPRDGNHGRGVCTCLSSQQEIEAAFAVAADEGSGVMVERFAIGNEHRLLVVDGKLVAAARGDPAVVVGNGRDTIRKLVEDQLNSDPLRGDTEDHPMGRITFDSSTRLLLKQRGYTAESVPAAGDEVVIQYNGNVCIDVTDEVHPEVAARAVEAARVVGLDVAGMDIVARDIRRPLEEQGGVIVEVNAGPGLLMHVSPAKGQPRPAGEAIVGSMFPAGDSGRVPTALLLETPEYRCWRAALWQVLSAAGESVGCAAPDGIWNGARQIVPVVHDEPAAADLMLANNAIERSLVVCSADGMRRTGLPIERCHVAICPPLDRADAATRQAGRVLLDSLMPTGSLIVWAHDRASVALARRAGRSAVLCSLDESAPVVTAHRRAGGATVFVRDDCVMYAQGAYETALFSLRRFAPILLGNRSRIEALLIALATAQALKVSSAQLRSGGAHFLASTDRWAGASHSPPSPPPPSRRTPHRAKSDAAEAAA